jgi:glc operon protein GlcG
MNDVLFPRRRAQNFLARSFPTKGLQERIGQGGDNLRLLAVPGVVPIDGGVPIVVDGKVIGAIGASGAAADQDGQCAMAGAAAAMAK